MVRVHRALLEALGEPARPVFLDTPAGFEMGVEGIAARFIDYFHSSLGLDLRVARYRHREDPPREQAEALGALTQANYIVAGPGSPTYAVEQLRSTPMGEAMVQRWRAGAQIVFASAATISLGRHALPVYEIYKVGQPLHWTEGLDLLGPQGFELAIVPHWDNAEGGTHDTRACFMGMERFGRLRALLPPTAVVLGIDEHSAVTLDLDRRIAEVRGKSGVTVLRGQDAATYSSGEAFPLDALGPAPERAQAHSAKRQSVAATSLGQAAALVGAGDLPAGLRIAADEAHGDLAALLHQAASAVEQSGPSDDDLDPLLQVLIELRSGLRERGEWALADGLRDRLLGVGFELRDTPEGTVWVRKGQPSAVSHQPSAASTDGRKADGDD
jgi:cyanophycinase-like exopeptidase